MSKHIVKQPNRMWCIVDDTSEEFIMEDATKGQVLRYFGELGKERYLENGAKAIRQMEEHGKTKGLGRDYEDFKEMIEGGDQS